MTHPRVMRLFGAVMMLGWSLAIPIQQATSLGSNVAWVSAMSAFALALSGASIYQAAAVACKQADDADVQEVLDKIDEVKT